MDYMKFITDNLVVLKPVLNRKGEVDFWYAGYRHVDSETGGNYDYLDVYNKTFNIQEKTPELALEKLMEHHRTKIVV